MNNDTTCVYICVRSAGDDIPSVGDGGHSYCAPRLNCAPRLSCQTQREEHEGQRPAGHGQRNPKGLFGTRGE